jgi:drug/metabolite transporter (DMT)-like permease
VPSILAFICWNRGVELIGASQAGTFLHLIPLFGALFSFVLLGEQLAFYHLFGALLIFAGIALTSNMKFGNKK